MNEQEEQPLNRLIVSLLALVAILTILVTLVFVFNAYRQSTAQSPIIATLAATAELAVLDTPSLTTPPATATETANLPTVTPTPTNLVTITVTSPDEPIVHEVADGETLWAIAIQYGLSLDVIAAYNNLDDVEQLQVGQTLLIPTGTGVGEAANTPTITPVFRTVAPADPPAQLTPHTPTPDVPTATLVPPSSSPANWPPSLISGTLAENYPLTQATSSGAIAIHYQPGTYPAGAMGQLAPQVDNIWADIQAELNGRVQRQVDLYLGGTLFAANPALQGFAQSWEYRAFVLVNGTFHTGEDKYIIAHELTHIVATHTFGPHSSAMLHEGLALHLPQHYLVDEAGYLPHTTICAAALNSPSFRGANQLSQLSYGPNAFGGHIRSFFNYNLSGCFVTYLLETYGQEQFARLYRSGDYVGVYGRSLADLDQEWQVWLSQFPVPVDAAAFVAAVDQVAAAYEAYVQASAGGGHANWAAYLHLNEARLLINQGNIEAGLATLEQFWVRFG